MVVCKVKIVSKYPAKQQLEELLWLWLLQFIRLLLKLS